MRTKIASILQSCAPDKLIGNTLSVAGWVRTVRDQKSFAFIELNDGSCLANLQVILTNTVAGYDDLLKDLSTGASVRFEGKMQKSPGKNQALELQATSAQIYGLADPATYPLQKKRHSFEFLRTIAHLRPRTNTQGAVFRVRSALAQATHRFFGERGFLYLQTPILTGMDAEGGGELFRVTTLPPGKKESSEDFFQKNAYLTVSGQLEAEIGACALSDVYTFGPTFRAENSHTSRHLAEFWMIEPEMAFADLSDNITCAESYLQYCIRYALDHCTQDLAFFDQWIEKGLVHRLEKMAQEPFARISYTEAIALLEKAPQSFTFPVSWGLDLQSEHERYLAEEYFQKPTIITDYPATIKAFYMRANSDGKTVAAMDVLVPKIGEVIGGSQREERLDVLREKMGALGLHEADYWWYLELRKFGTVPHSGFGLGFERLIQLVTGMENIRDVIAFPRFPGHLDF